MHLRFFGAAGLAARPPVTGVIEDDHDLDRIPRAFADQQGLIIGHKARDKFVLMFLKFPMTSKKIAVLA